MIQHWELVFHLNVICKQIEYNPEDKKKSCLTETMTAHWVSGRMVLLHRTYDRTLALKRSLVFCPVPSHCLQAGWCLVWFRSEIATGTRGTKQR